MNTLEHREKCLEGLYARQLELSFLIKCKAMKSIGFWAARRMNLPEAQAHVYAMKIMKSALNSRNTEEIKRRIQLDLWRASVEVSLHVIDVMLIRFFEEARRRTRKCRGGGGETRPPGDVHL